jgi:transcriptional regulator with GAF, ATPase, and Fis domain
MLRGPNRVYVLMATDTDEDRLSHLEQHEADLDVLAEIAELLSTNSEPRQLLRSVLAALERKLGMIRGTVMLLMPDGDELLVEAAQHVPESSLKNTRYRSGEGIIGTVVETGQPAIVPRVSEEPRFQNRIHNRSEDDFAEVSFLCVPIRLESEVVGTLSVDLPAQSPELLRESARDGDCGRHDRLRRSLAPERSGKPPDSGGGKPPPPRCAPGTVPAGEHHR